MTLETLGSLDEAIINFQRALALKPDFVETHNNLGNVYRKMGQLEEAIECFEKADDAHSHASLLECVYALKQKGRFYELLDKIILKDKGNRGVAAISAFASNQFGCHDPYPFCNAPLDFVYINSLVSMKEQESGLSQALQKQIEENILKFNLRPVDCNYDF